MGRVIKKEPTTSVIKKVSTNQISKPLSKDELIQRRRETQKFYSQMSLNRAKEASPARSKITRPSFVPQELSLLTKKAGIPPPSKLSAKISAPKSEPKPAKKDDFKASSASLQMIKSGNIQIGNMGRLSMRTKKKVEIPRMSLLPLGINVFDKNTSEADRLKVYEYMRNQQGGEPDGRRMSVFGTPSLNRNRLVRFQFSDSIPEDGDTSEIKDLDCAGDTFQPTTSAIPSSAPHSILKKKKRLSKASAAYIAQSSACAEGSSTEENRPPAKLIFSSSSEESLVGTHEEPKTPISSKKLTFSSTVTSSKKIDVRNAEDLYRCIMDHQHFLKDLSSAQIRDIINIAKEHASEFQPDFNESNSSLVSLPNESPKPKSQKARRGSKVGFKALIKEKYGDTPLKSECSGKKVLFDETNVQSPRRSLRIGRRDADS